MVGAGLFNNTRNLTKTGVPFLQDIPILGQLFSSTRWENDETELLVVVTPVLIDAMHPLAQNVLPLLPDTTLPAREAIRDRLPKGADSTRRVP